jgi:hypothetical protein
VTVLSPSAENERSFSTSGMPPSARSSGVVITASTSLAE